MYTVAGITFYDESDSDEDIAKIYKECLIDEIIKVDEEASREELKENEIVIANAISIVHNYKSSSVYTVNRYIGKSVVETHEDHWLRFLKSYGFNASIVHIDTTPFLKHLAYIRYNREDNLWVGLSSINENKILIVDIFSSIVNDNGENLKLSNHFIRSVQSMIPSFVNKTSQQLFIMYGPYSDINLALSVTRLLHLLL